MAKKWRNRMHSMSVGLIEETYFDESDKEKAKKDHAEKKIKLKKDETADSHLCPHTIFGDAEELYDCLVDPRSEYEVFTKKTDTRLGDLLVPLSGLEPP